jgi:hypothetical protein
MQHQKHDDPAILDQAPWYHSNLMTQLRLFGLLALMIPLFSGLQYIVREGVPRVEVRLVAQDVPTTVAIEVPVERVVERVVYVPVDRTSMVATTGAMEPARDVDLAPVKDEPTAIAEVPTEASTAEPEAVAEGTAPSAPVAEAPTETPEILGVIAYAPPPPAPIVRAAPYVARPVVVAVPEAAETEEIAAEAETDAAVVADAEDDQADAEAVADVPETDPGARVAMVVSARPLGPGSNDSPLNGLRHELHQSEPRHEAAAPAPDPEPAAEADIPDEGAAKSVAPEADGGGEAAESEPAEEVTETEAAHEESDAPVASAEVEAEAVKETDEAPVEVAAEDAAPVDDGVAESEAPQEESGEARQAEQHGPVLISNQ